MLEYNVAFHVHSDLVLASGLRITLRSLTQGLTYAGLLEGYPNREMNEAEILTAARDGAALTPGAIPVHVIPPARRDFLRKPGDMAGDHSFGQPEWLPMIRCSALFDGGPIAGKPSPVQLVWYQDELALPIAPAIVDYIRALAWERIAAG